MNYQRFILFEVMVCLLSHISSSRSQGIPFEVNSTSISSGGDVVSGSNINSTNTPVESDGPGDVGDDDDEDDSEKVDKFVYDYDEDYDQPKKPTNQSKPKTGIVYTWAKWPKWNKCSRTCGGGIQTRIRNCVEKKQTGTELLITEFQPGSDGIIGCFGVWKKFRMCNQKPCPNDDDFRNQQCAMRNKIPYKGKLYEWEGYVKEYHECELTCKPIDLNYYTSLGKSVIDGTPCTKPSIYFTHFYRGRAVCVDGICKAVHKTGAIRGVTTNDVKTKCGSVLCRPISEIFSKATLPHGYFYITTIGSGATNLTIKQMASSDNRLAIRSIDNKFIVNGNNYVSESGTYEYNGDAFDYDKELQIIESKGPLSKSIDVLLIVRGINPGVKYDYNIPVASAGISDSEEGETHWNEQGVPLDDVEENKIPDVNEGQPIKPKDRKRRKFSWKLLGFGPCNRSCGAGVRSPIFRCIKDSATRFYTPRRCMFSEKPVFHEDIYKCNLQLCPAYWQTMEYGECVCTDGVGQHNRTVSCVQEQASGAVEIVDETECEADKPVESEECDCPKKIRRKIYSQRPDKSAKIYSRLIGSSANVYNSFNQTLGLRKVVKGDQDKTGVWLMSEWNSQCSNECGSGGLEQRSIYCDRTAPYTDVCDLRITPAMSRRCDQSKKCLEGEWFTSNWSKCSGDCFNLSKKRTVLCIIDGMVVEDDGCNLDEKPTDTKNCTHREVNYCGPKWYYSEWFECSRPCGEGTQRRYAKCLDYDWQENVLQESNSCKYMEREPVYGTCNTQKCEEIESLVSSVQNDLEFPSCTDELASCKRINKQRLCKVAYYQKMCCQSCEGVNSFKK
ncbi:thrombospondin type-1 domain-containing protein 4-like [Episyrphus balteatus]|uniref:thrombospondin type-1 domain-containing protein 4-like n=1 Tax=Episyrphus balteatus TaxID=286459 RepID=UPI0024869B81|nr:thrombospondin type-1 domain-containing protein 4-like [Episyrphus balteatus]